MWLTLLASFSARVRASDDASHATVIPASEISSDSATKTDVDEELDGQMFGGLMRNLFMPYPYGGGSYSGYGGYGGMHGGHYGSNLGHYNNGLNYSNSSGWDRGYNNTNINRYGSGGHAMNHGGGYGSYGGGHGHAGHYHRRLDEDATSSSEETGFLSREHRRLQTGDVTSTAGDPVPDTPTEEMIDGQTYYKKMYKRGYLRPSYGHYGGGYGGGYPPYHGGYGYGGYPSYVRYPGRYPPYPHGHYHRRLQAEDDVNAPVSLVPSDLPPEFFEIGTFPPTPTTVPSEPAAIISEVPVATTDAEDGDDEILYGQRYHHGSGFHPLPYGVYPPPFQGRPYGYPSHYGHYHFMMPPPPAVPYYPFSAYHPMMMHHQSPYHHRYLQAVDSLPELPTPPPFDGESIEKGSSDGFEYAYDHQPPRGVDAPPTDGSDDVPPLDEVEGTFEPGDESIDGQRHWKKRRYGHLPYQNPYSSYGRNPYHTPYYGGYSPRYGPPHHPSYGGHPRPYY